MHLFVLTRGHQDWVKRWANDLAAQYFPYNIPQDVSGTNLKAGTIAQVQLAVRPIQLFELVMPEPCLGEVCHSLWPTNIDHTKYDKKLWLLRKILGAQPVPKFDENLPARIINNQFVACYPVGIKPDKFNEIDGHEEL